MAAQLGPAAELHWAGRRGTPLPQGGCSYLLLLPPRPASRDAEARGLLNDPAGQDRAAVRSRRKPVAMGHEEGAVGRIWREGLRQSLQLPADHPPHLKGSLAWGGVAVPYVNVQRAQSKVRF